MQLKKKTIDALISYGIVIIAFIVCQYLIATKAMPRTLKGQMIPICVYIVMAVSLNLVVGISGELSLGHAGFMSIGAFTGAIVSTYLLTALGLENGLIRLIIALVAGGAMAGVFGVLIGIPVLRLRGDYLAIVTLAFGEIIRNVVNCLYFSVDGKRLLMSFNNANLAGTIIVNGPAGTKGIKNHYKRTRPFVYFNTGTCSTREDEEDHRYTYSYPSTHSTYGQALALVLSEIDPANQAGIIKKGADYGYFRVVCGFHWQSDVELGRIVASHVVARLHSNAEFMDALNHAKAEYRSQQK